nr:pericentrin-like isoform X4 [Danaus plexippus plexippus]
MDENSKGLSEPAEIKNVLPDVVNSQQLTTRDAVGDDVTSSTPDTSHHTHEKIQHLEKETEENSGIESISENIPFNIDYSISESEHIEPNAGDLLRVTSNNEIVSKNSSLNVPQDASQHSSWNIDVNRSDMHISEESPVILALSSDTSKEVLKSKEHEGDGEKTPEQSSNSEYLDSLNDTKSHKSNNNDGSIDAKTTISSGKDAESLGQCSSGSEEIIKLDIRGQAAPKFPVQSTKIIFGPPPDGSTMMSPHLDSIPVFQTLMSPCLIGPSDGVTIEEVFEGKDTPEKSQSLMVSCSDKEQDVLVEEILVEHDQKEVGPDNVSPSKSIHPDEASLNTMSTEYKTLCEEYHFKLVHLEEAVSRRDQLIEELTVSLQRSVRERDDLRHDNEHLLAEVKHLQRLAADRSHSDDTVKAQLSDFMKYQSMLRDDSTKFYSALMSGTSSRQSSNGEKDNDKEEITVNYSRSDLRSSASSGDCQEGLHGKLMAVLDRYDARIEEETRNELRGTLVQVMCDEVARLRIDCDTDVRELEAQLAQEKHARTGDVRRLRDLLAEVKAGSADVDQLREELDAKHKKEMENLRTYFEKMCLDIERRLISYSEEVMRGRACVSPVSEGADAEAEAGAGDARRRTRSADLPSLLMETSTPLEGTLRQINKKLEQQLLETRTAHLAHVRDLAHAHQQTVADLEQRIAQLKSHIQATENTEANVSVYQQDIDLELEKVLLSDPDAELSSWPLELVALRDRIHHDRELSSVRDELSSGEGDKWRQRRNNSFDQNRQLEEVTRERDGLRRVAGVLQRAVSSLVAYCASAEDELNRTVLNKLLGHLAADDDTIVELDSRPSTPVAELSVVGETHVHLAPDLHSILVSLDEAGVRGFLQQQRDLGDDIKRELDASLKRLRHEAKDLLQLSARLASNKARQETRMLENSTREAKEEDERECINCMMQRKNVEEAMSECLQRENLLRSDLDGAMMKIAHLMGPPDRTHSDDVVEGYGTGGRSLDGLTPRAQLAADLEHALRERDDLKQQLLRTPPVHGICCQKLEAANRQLRSTRQFVEEQAAEREAERDEFAERLAELRDENSRLAARLQTNARIVNEMSCLRLARCNCREHDRHVEQLESQTREMNQIIADLEGRKGAADEELKAAEEQVSLLRDIINNLETQLEEKTAREEDVLRELGDMRSTIDDRDRRMRELLAELERSRGRDAEREAATQQGEEGGGDELLGTLRDDAKLLEEQIHSSVVRLEGAYERASGSLSERTEDVSVTGARAGGERGGGGARGPALEELSGVWDQLKALERAGDAALKRIDDLHMQRQRLKDVAQEVRAERDVLQARMSEQALRISSLSARLAQQRCDADALAHDAAAQLSVRLHDAQAEVQRLTEELSTKDKQLARLKQSHEERDKYGETQPVFGNSCNPKDRAAMLEREFSNAKSKIEQLESLVRSLETDKEKLQSTVREQQRTLAEKEEQLNEIMALNLVEDQSEVIQAKTSARTLSDIVSISEFDEQDLIMRRAELKGQNASITNTDHKDKTNLNKTLPPDVQKPNMSSLNLDYADHFDGTNFTPRADSLPIHLTSTQNKEVYKRNANETTIFGEGIKHSTAQNIPDNCSMYPNRDVSESKNLSVEPKKINFSMEPSDNRTHDEEFASLKDLGITLDVKQENFPDILTHLKREIRKSRSEVELYKAELKNAEEQLCEFPALKEEVEELKGLLENTMATMENDKKFYENQLDTFASNKKLLEQRLKELTQEVHEKSKDLNLLKEDILRRETMILELAKEKMNLANKISDLEIKIDDLNSKNMALVKYEAENKQLKEKLAELQRLEQLLSEKNQQIDSLNQHLDRLDDLQRCLNDKTEEMEGLKQALNMKTKELFQVRDSVNTLNTDIAKVIEENDQLSQQNKELKLKLTKLEKEQENAAIRLQNNETELNRVNSQNSDLAARIEELKVLHDTLADKETEIEILHEDINLYHNEIAALREQLKMVSRSPSPRNKNTEAGNTVDRQATNDRKQLVKIKKQISLLQHELDFQKKELNDKAFELAKAKLDLTEARNNISQMSKQISDSEQLQMAWSEQQQQLEKLAQEKEQLERQLETVLARLREETDVGELRHKLCAESERCGQLERELRRLRETTDRPRPSPGRARSPTAELERAVRDQLDYSHALDDDIMDQILSASSDEREDIPRLVLNSSNQSTSSMKSTSSERMQRLRNDNEKLQLKLEHLECRLKDKDALISELNRVRDKLSSECQSGRLRLEAERDRSARLALLLDSHKDTASSLHDQDSSMIDMLKRRLETAMKSELEAQQRERDLLQRLQQLDRTLPAATSPTDQLKQESEDRARLQSSLSAARLQLEAERRRAGELHAMLDHERNKHRRDLDEAAATAAALRGELAELRRLKHESGVELVRTKELLHTQSDTIAQLEKKYSARSKHNDTITGIENEKTDLAREMATLRRCLTDAPQAQLQQLLEERQQLRDTIRDLRGQLEARNDDKEQAIRYLHSRWVRLESCRKALVWQKRYLQRMVAGYGDLERKLGVNEKARTTFKSVAWSCVAVLRMSFLVRRRNAARNAASALAQSFAPCTPLARPPPLAHRLLQQDMKLCLPLSPTVGDVLPRSPLVASSPREERGLTRCPRGDAASSYTHRLDSVSRRLAALQHRDN